jgi:seryl-tRNA synthetase
MTTTEAIGEGLTFEKVWAAIQATGEQMKETDKRLSEYIKATDEQIKATDEQIKATGEQIKATGEQMKETDKRFGHLTNRFGEIVEYMVVPKLEEKFRELGFEFEKLHRNSKFKDPEHGIFMELDAFLENGSKAMAVDINSKPTVEEIDDHV